MGNDIGQLRVSRRMVVAGLGATFLLPHLPRAAGAVKDRLAFVGCYTDQPASADGHGEGIYLVRFSAAQGRLTMVGLAAKTPSPSWIALSPDRRFLYAANELEDFGGGKSGSVSAFAVSRADGKLTPLNTVSSKGATPAHLSVHPSGRFVFVANYGGGNVAVLPIGPDGSLGEAVGVATDNGPRSPDRADDEPLGNFAKSDHAGAHVHMVSADPSGRFVFANDVGLDRTYVWRFDTTSGALTPADPPFVAATPGAAPRHFAFHPNGRFLYNLTEHEGHVVVYALDPANARLSLRQSVSVLPRRFAGSNLASELVISPDGRFLYAGNRLHDAISVLAIGQNGLVHLVGETSVLADYPRSFGLTPDGGFIVSCNQRGDSLTLFRRDAKNGGLHFTGDYLPVGSPTVIAFLD